MFKGLDKLIFTLRAPFPLLICAALLLVIAAASLKKRLLTVSGAAAAVVLGMVILSSLHFGGLFLLFAFFIGGSLIGRLRERLQGRDRAFAEKKGGTRDAVQVLANGLMAGIAALIYALGGGTAALIAFGAAIAEANSDTFAGELGRLSKTPPISVRTGKVVPKGVSGGVTLTGTLAGLGASALIALLWLLCFDCDKRLLCAGIIMLCGFIGCVADSVLGATVQALYKDERTGALSEHPTAKDGTKLTLVQGVRWIDNDAVNMLSNLLAAALGMAIGSFV